ncbi:MAG: phenylalanine--tRNA ligase subunit beta [Candidatus Saccharimonadales bacterium]
MKISLNYLKQFLDFDLPPVDQLADIIGARLGALEEQPVDLSDVYKDVVIVKVVDSEAVSGSDHLNICKIDDGGNVKTVERDERGLINVVCGAANVRAGIFAAWLPPGSVLPASYFADKLTLEVRQIHGQKSNGMLASPKELNLSDDHQGIFVIDVDTRPGQSFIDAYSLDDYIIDIENKMFTHRPDCFGLLGIAREVSGILNHPFKSPDWYLSYPKLAKNSKLNLSIDNQVPELVPRFSLVVIDNIKVMPSSSTIQSYLTRMGVRPVNNIVDLTNIIMLESGQPLHAYDYHKLLKLSASGLVVSVRKPKSGDSLTLLNGKTVAPPDSSIGIAVGDNLIGLGGVMGGENSEIDDQTTSIVLEAACFDMYSIRRTSMELGIFSEAVTRFTKGQSPLQTTRVLDYALAKLKELVPDCRIASDIVDDLHLADEVIESDSLHAPVKINSAYINERLGTGLKVNDIARLLKNVEFDIETNGDELNIKAPFWRTDIEIKEDIVEEVGRLYGYENIQSKTLSRPVLATRSNPSTDFKDRVRTILVRSGANELMTHSFVPGKLLDRAGQDKDQAFKLANALSPELQYYRLSLTPSLLDKVHPNIKAGYNQFVLFEIGKGHNINQFDSKGIPMEFEMLDVIFAANEKSDVKGAAFYHARKYLDYLADCLAIDLEYRPFDNEEDYQVAKPYDHKRSAKVFVRGKDIALGMIGEYKASLKRDFKLPKYCAGFGLGITQLMSVASEPKYLLLTKYPHVAQDVTLQVSSEVKYSQLYDLLRDKLNELKPANSLAYLKPLSIYQKKNNLEFKNFSFRLIVASYERTLTDKEVDNLLTKLSEQATNEFKAKRL